MLKSFGLFSRKIFLRSADLELWRFPVFIELTGFPHQADSGGNSPLLRELALSAEGEDRVIFYCLQALSIHIVCVMGQI